LAASPGKLLFSIKIANLDRTNADRMTLLKRSVLKNSSSILQFLGFLTALSLINGLATLVGVIIFIAYFFALSEKRQTLYDMICNIKLICPWFNHSVFIKYRHPTPLSQPFFSIILFCFLLALR
jgi:uncharacterized RDD family membrane protein YckC